MNPTAKFILIGIVAISLATGPTVLLSPVYFFPDSWRRILYNYQSLAGSFVTFFAAGLALLGVWITVTVQRENVDRQLAEQRQNAQEQLKAQREQFDKELGERRATEDRACAMRRRQVASAFIGEINVILSAFRGQDWRQVPQKALEDLKRARNTGPSTFRLKVSRPVAEYATFFRANAAEVGQFPQPIPQNLLMFYGIYTQLQDNLTQAARASDEDFKHMEAPSVEQALKDQLQQLDSLEGFGAVLIPQLREILNEPVQ